MIIEKRELFMLQPFQKKNVAAYARVSCGKDQHLHSVISQIDYYRKRIKRNPLWEYQGVFSDEDATGTKAKREGFDEMLSLCRKGKIDLILTKSISRFARNTVDLLTIIRELRELGIGVEFEREGINTLSADGELMLSILASYAQEESLSASENMKWSIREGYKKGSLKQVRRTYGYLVELGEVTVVPDEAEIVQEIFERYAAGELPSMIAQDLNERGIKTLEGTTWKPNRMNQIVSNIFYTGNTLLQKQYVKDHLSKKQVRNRGELPQYYVEDSHEALVSTELYDRVQKIKAQRQYKKKPDTKSVFSGKLVCGICGANLNRKHDRGNHKWQCRTYRLKGVKGCRSKQIPEDTLMEVSAEVLGLSSFDDFAFDEDVLRVMVHNDNRLVFELMDGSEIDAFWQDRSRSKSWTSDMRRKAGKKTKERYRKHGKTES